MKRPLATLGFLFVLSQLLAIYLEGAASLWIAAILLYLFSISLFFPNIRKTMAIPAVLLMTALSFLQTGVYSNAVSRPVLELDGKPAVVEAYIYDLPSEVDGKYVYVFQASRVTVIEEDGPGEEKEMSFRFRLTSSSPLEYDVYENIRCQLVFSKPEGGFGYTSQNSYRAKGISLFAYFQNYEVQELYMQPPDLHYRFLQLRKVLLDKLDWLLPERQAAMAKGILFGDKSTIPAEVLGDFQICGIRHVLAVSGLHTSFFCQLLLLLLGIFHFPERLKYFLAMLGILIFMGLAGFTPSVNRAGVMYLVYLMGKIIFRQADSLNSLGLAGLILCLLNPYCAADIGFQLSFLATMGILLYSERISRAIFRRLNWNSPGRLPGYIVSTFSTTIAATLFTLPVVSLSFGTISIISPIVNLFVIYPVQLLLTCAVLALLFSFLGPFAFMTKPFSLLTGILANYLMDCTHWFAGLPVTLLPVSQEFFQLWLALTLLLCALGVLFYRPDRKKLQKRVALLSCITLMVGIFSYQVPRRNQITLGILDVGDGLGVCLTYQGCGIIITDAGKKYTPQACQTYLKKYGCHSAQALILPSMERQSVLTAAQLLSEGLPDRIYFHEEGEIPDEIEKRLYPECVLLQGQGRMELEVTPGGEGEASEKTKILIEAVPSEGGLWYNIQIGNHTVLIATGENDARFLPLELRSPELLLVRDAVKNLEELQPGLLVLSSSEKSMSRCLPELVYGAPYLYTTAENGTLSFGTDGEGEWEVQREA